MSKFIVCFIVFSPFALWGQSLVTKKTKHDVEIAIFLSVDCPISQKYLTTLDTLYKKYNSSEVKWYFVLPGHTQKQVRNFKNEFDVSLPLTADPKFKYTKSFQALITPEAVVQVNGRTIYRGAIDNWFYALGKYRPRVSQHFLDDALKNYFSGLKIDPVKTEAIGCPIPKYH